VSQKWRFCAEKKKKERDGHCENRDGRAKVGIGRASDHCAPREPRRRRKKSILRFDNSPGYV
jgi:hypothetical protein